MLTLELLQRRIASVDDLQSIVRTMKALAAVSIRQYEKSVESLVEYNRTIEMGLQVALSERNLESAVTKTQRVHRVGAVVFGSDHGMCGQFNEQIASYAIRAMGRIHARREDWQVLGVGVRAVARLEDAGQTVEASLAVPNSAAGMTATVQQLLLTLDEWRGDQRVNCIYLFYNQPSSAALYCQHMTRLLPIQLSRLHRLKSSKWQSRSLPQISMDSERLLSALIHHHIFVLLQRACAESLVSENTSRLTAMQAAEKNIREHQQELTALYHGQRQSAITGELLDIVSGFEVLSGS